MIVNAEINNVPEKMQDKGYIVARIVDHELWYYGIYEDKARAVVAAKCVDGIILEREERVNKEIQVGDEVVRTNGSKELVVGIREEYQYWGKTYADVFRRGECGLKQTGKHYPEIEAAVAEKEDKENDDR